MTQESSFPRILVSGASYSTDNGQGVFTVNLCERLARRNIQVAALVASPIGKAYQETRNGVKMYYMKSLSVDFIRKGEYYTVLPIDSIRKAFDDFQPEVVHLNDHYPLSFLVYWEARRRGIQIIGTNHFMPENLAPFLPFYHFAPNIVSWILWRWMLMLYNHFNLVTTQSETAAEIVKQNGLMPPVVTVSCGVDTHQFNPIPDADRLAIRKRYGIDADKKVFLYVGRLDGEKRLDSVVEAVRYLQRDDIQIVLAGKGKEAEKLKNRVQEINRPGQVVFPGYIPQADLPNLLNSADCFIMPSDAELLSIATLEAMSCGLPVLAARAYALTELVSDGENGYLFTPRDARDIAEKINLIADQPERWASMKNISLARSKGHDIESVMNRYIRLFQLVRVTRVQKHIQMKVTNHKISN